MLIHLPLVPIRLVLIDALQCSAAYLSLDHSNMAGKDGKLQENRTRQLEMQTESHRPATRN